MNEDTPFESKKESREINDWHNEHGEPDFTYLESLAEDESPLALEKLRSVALDLDVDFDMDTTRQEIVDRVRLVTESDE